MVNDQNIANILRGILEGVDIGSDESYRQVCQQIGNSSLLPWQKELFINQLPSQYKTRKNSIAAGKLVLDLTDLIFNVNGKK